MHLPEVAPLVGLVHLLEVLFEATGVASLAEHPRPAVHPNVAALNSRAVVEEAVAHQVQDFLEIKRFLGALHLLTNV